MASVRFSPAAQDDLDAIFDYTAAHWGLEQAIHYLGEISDACLQLAQSPRQGRDASHIRAGYRHHPTRRHVLWFREESGGIAVIRILHQRMDVARHL